MSISERLASRYFAEKYARLFAAMSLGDAKKTLGFPANAEPSPEEISKAYKRKALENHPDRGGDHTKMVEVNVAKDILEGKRRPDGPGGRPGPSRNPGQPSGGWSDDDKLIKKDKIKKGTDFSAAKSKAPGSVDWKFRSEGIYGKPTPYAKEQASLNYVHGYVCYGRTDSKHVFMLVEQSRPGDFRPYYYVRQGDVDKKEPEVLYEEWSMEVSETYPLTQDLAKLFPKAFKSILGKGKLLGDPGKTTTKYVTLAGLTEVEFERSHGGVALKDILIGTGLSSGAASDRKIVVELVGQENRQKYDAEKKAGNIKYQADMWRAHDFTLFVNGKGHPLRQATIDNLNKQGSRPGTFWFNCYMTANFEFSKRRVITRMDKSLAKDLLEMLEQSLANEPAELTVQLLSAIEGLEGGKKTAASPLLDLGVLDNFIATKVAQQFTQEGE